MRNKRTFTLLEWMIAISLLLIASGLVGWKMRDAIATRKFQSDLDRLRERCVICQRIATATQTDWKGVLRKSGADWVFELSCFDSPKMRGFAPLRFSMGAVTFEGKKTELLEFAFYASGKISPEGHLIFSEKERRKKWILPEEFLGDKGGLLGPLHPDEIN